MKESNVSPDIQELQSLLMDLQSAIKFSRLYPVEHPLLKKAIQRALDRLTLYLSVHNQLRLRIRLGDIFSGPLLINKSHEVLQQLAQNLYALGIQELIFYAGATDAEVLKFICTITLSPEAAAERGGIESIWEQEGFSTILINLTLNAEIQTILGAFSSEELEDRRDLPAQAHLLIDYLNGGAALLDSGGRELLGHLMPRTQQFADWLVTSAQNHAALGSAGTAAELAQALAQPLSRIIGTIKASPEGQREEQYRHLAKAVDHLGSEVKGEILSFWTGEKVKAGELSGRVPDALMIELGVRPAQSEGPPPEGEGTALGSSMSDSTPGELPGPLAQMGAGVEGALAGGAANAGGGPLLRTQEVSEIQMQDVIDEEELAELTTFSLLELKSVEDSLRAIATTRAGEPFWQTTLRLLPLIGDSASLSLLLRSLRERVQSHLQKNEPEELTLGLHKIKELTASPHLSAEMKNQLEVLIQELTGAEVRRQLLKAARGADKTDTRAASILDYCSLLSSDAIEDLLDWLEVEEQRWLRRAICQLLVQLGARHLEVIWKRLSSPRWYVLRNVVSILGMINNPGSIPHLIPLVKHEHQAVRKEVLKSLGLSEDPSVFETLVEASHDKEDEVQVAALESLGLLKDPRAGAFLMDFLRQRHWFFDRVEPKKAAIQTLAVLGAIEAIPLLDKLTHNSWLSFSSRHKEVAEEARKGLEQLRKKRLHDYRTQSQFPGAAS